MKEKSVKDDPRGFCLIAMLIGILIVMAVGSVYVGMANQEPSPTPCPAPPGDPEPENEDPLETLTEPLPPNRGWGS